MLPLKEKVLAPAKLNLSLRIVGRRHDGYHLLDTLVVPVSLYDELVLGVAPAGSSQITVRCDSRDVPDGPANLAYRAAALFLDSVEQDFTVDIGIAKRIPVGSGLGGGSSDAAAVLTTLNRLLGSPLSDAGLAALALELGADVTFFMFGRPARARGIGEQLEFVELPDRLFFVLCSDGYPMPTKSVYARVDLSLTSAGPNSNILTFIGGRARLEDVLVNDLEAAAAEIHPEVLSLKARLMEEGAVGALMTGSGSAVFGVWYELHSAVQAAMRLRGCGLWAEAVHVLDAAPTVRS